MLLSKYLSRTLIIFLFMFPVSEGNIAYSKVKIALDETGLIWVDHLNLQANPSGTTPAMQYRPSTGVDLIVESNPANTTSPFPRTLFLTNFIAAPPPGFFVNGVRLCYGILGDHPDTKVIQLRISQFDETSTFGGTIPPGYDVRLDDASVGALAPPPSTTNEDPSAFACINSITDTTTAGPSVPACIDTDTGTLAIGVEVQIGDADDLIKLRALAFQYDLTLPDTVTCPSS